MGKERELKIDPTTWVCPACGFNYGPGNPTTSPAEIVTRSCDGNWRAYPLVARKDGVPVLDVPRRDASQPESGTAELICPSCGKGRAWSSPVYAARGMKAVSGRAPESFTWILEDALDD